MITCLNSTKTHKYCNSSPILLITGVNISLTPVMSKIGKSFIYKWLLESIEDRIDPYQFGAIKNSCTTDALMLVIHNLFQALDGTGSLIRICLLDFSKAFHKIDHNVLISKLRNMNIHPVKLIG